VIDSAARAMAQTGNGEEPEMIDDVYLPARKLPMPSSVSPQARSALVAAAAREQYPYPELDDIAGWEERIQATDDYMISLYRPRCSQLDHERSSYQVAGRKVYVSRPREAPTDRVLLHTHGGALIAGGGEVAGLIGDLNAARSGVETHTVDYRMPPEAAYPAALDDCVAAYRALLDRFPANRIVIGGESAGGNLGPALVLRARDEGLPLPAGLVMISPEVDLTESGDSFEANRGVDVMMPEGLMAANRFYADGHDLSHPYLSPLFGDFTKGFPRSFLQSGTRDLFLSNTVRMHRALRRAGIPAELHIFEAMPHGGFSGAPEDEELNAEVKNFVASCWV
jgi:acetyl esterase/lipase